MIHQVSFKNYKIFKDMQVIELKPVTVLIGKNNTGKSAILKLMTLIEGALNGPFTLNNHNVVISNEFRDLIHGKFSRSLELQLLQKEQQQYSSLKINIVVDSNKDVPLVESWIFQEGNDEKSFTDVINLQKNDEFTYNNKVDNSDCKCSFDGIWLSQDSGLYNNKSKQLFSIKTDFIGAIREKAKLDYRLNIEDEKSDITGKNLYDFLIRDFLTTEKVYFNQISNWISEKFEGWNLYIDVDSEPYHIRLRKNNLDIDLTESGMGISQSLPLLTRAFRPCREETLIIIEEPESHLHPYAHSQIAQLFAESIKKDKNKRYLIETHSQNFVLRLRRLIAEGFLSIEELGIYYVDFDEDKNESNLREIKVDKGGGVEWWPEGIFGETTIETRAIYNAQLNDIRNVDSDK